MKPVNNKSMINFLFNQMEKLDNKDTTTEEAREQCNLAKQINSAMRYELERARVSIEISNHNTKTSDSVELRNIENSNF